MVRFRCVAYPRVRGFTDHALPETPSIGQDYAYFLPYLLSNHYWLVNNGWAIPWVTPAHCTGILYFANPQSLFYWPLQALM